MDAKRSSRKSTRHSAKRTAGIKTKTIRQKRFIPATPTDIYDALLDAKTHTEFTGAPATCERWVGGQFTAWDGYITGTNLKLENSRRIIQEWKTTEWPQGYGPSTIEFTFRPKGKGTEISMIQTNVPAEQAASYQKGWIEHYWKPMKKFFALH